MKLLSLLTLAAFVTLPGYAAVDRNLKAQSLDNMINIQRQEIQLARESRSFHDDKEVRQYFDKVIDDREAEVNRLTEIRNRLYSDVKPTVGQRLKSDASKMTAELDQELRKMETETKLLYDRLASKLHGEQAQEVHEPKMEVKETKSGYDIRAEVPGMNQKDIKINLMGNNLIVEGIRRSEITENKKDLRTSEFLYGDYYRSINLAKKVDPKSLKVDFKDGVVDIHLTKV